MVFGHRIRKDGDSNSGAVNEQGIVVMDIWNERDDKADQIVAQGTDMGCCLLINRL